MDPRVYMLEMPKQPSAARRGARPVPSWGILGVVRKSPAAMQGYSPLTCPILVGRDQEIAALERTLEAAGAGVCAVAAVTGEPGIGESRIARHIEERVLRRGFLVLTGQCRERDRDFHWSDPTSLGLIEMLPRRLMGVPIGILPVGLGRQTAVTRRSSEPPAWRIHGLRRSSPAARPT